MDLDVAVTGGVVRGAVEQGLLVFRGMPYAAPTAPFGSPQQVVPWDGVRDATRFGPAPPQSGLPSSDAMAEGDGDWLTINVWTPGLVGDLPVMVWIQGGAYLFGSSGRPEHDGGALAREGVVVVTFNYRVGLPGFGQLEGAPANRGLLDQVAALEWVQRNIRSFGGDADRVTVFGQSAGGGSVAALLVMPRAKGLFRRAVAQSVPGPFFTPRLAADVTRVCAEEVGMAPAELLAADPGTLAAAGDAVLARSAGLVGRWGPVAHAQVPFAPVVDGEVLPCTPWQGLTGQVDLVVGHTRDEQRLLTALSGQLGTITEAQADETTDALGPDPRRYRDAFAVAEERYEAVRSDWLFRMPSLKLAEAQVAAGGRAYLYELTWTAPGMGGVLGACHGLDVPLVLGNLTAGEPAMLIGDVMPEAAAVSAQMRQAWVAFATTGDPGWPPYDTGLTKIFDVEPSVAEYPERVSAEIWRDVVPEVLDLR